MPSTSDTAAVVSGQTGSAGGVIHALLRGSFGFAMVSLAAFAVWAFAGKWLHAHAGEAGLYAACAVVFLGLSGLALHPLVNGARSLPRFYLIFIPAFLAYAIAWCAAWFVGRFGLGEWLGSLCGSIVFVAATGCGFRNYRGFAKVCLVFFCLHSAGYFLGGEFMRWTAGPAEAGLLSGFSKTQISLIAKLGWGLLYGLGFGAGIGYAFCIFQRQAGSS